MGKHGFLTPKAISNRIKSKGLQKLRWYCQMCQKQCRDENGFKCHCMSEGHQRQMSIVSMNPNKVIDSFSEDFEALFMELLKRRFGEKRVYANMVYQEYIAESHHIHMNSTMWTTLTGFVKYLGRTGKCTVDQTERGWFLQFVKRDAESIESREARKRKEQAAKDEDQRHSKNLRQQVKASWDKAQSRGKKSMAASTDLKRDESTAKVALRLTVKKQTALKRTFASAKATSKNATSTKESGPSSKKRPKLSAMETIMARDMERKRQEEAARAATEAAANAKRTDYWITEDIVVKVVDKKLAGGRYYKKKGVVRGVEDRYIASLHMVDDASKIRIDQEDLETVIPALGRRVKILNGEGRGKIGVLKSLDIDNFQGVVRLSDGVTLKKDYEDISKYSA